MSESRIGGAADVVQDREVSDESLLERLAAGTDQHAASELYDRYQGAMYGLAIRITRDQALAQDAVQEAFVGVWRNASRYAAGRASVRTWMLAITHHRAIDILRRRRATIEMPDADSGESALSVPDVWPDVSRSLDRDTVRGAIETLPAAQRQAIELAYFEGLTQVEIAERTGAPLGTVKSRVRLGLQQMRSVLEDER
ncbi:MAG TPA: sigma-70 family RNA polymerase sigma factor [Candidatus Limnocylindrales bacterium]|nr:sigma-70 family RNA polymerase sigma factor [Candidatus Limnocylindrales bacterium]